MFVFVVVFVSFIVADKGVVAMVVAHGARGSREERKAREAREKREEMEERKEQGPQGLAFFHYLSFSFSFFCLFFFVQQRRTNRGKE